MDDAMTSDRSAKKAARARMAATGEPYNTARRAVQAGPDRPAPGYTADPVHPTCQIRKCPARAAAGHRSRGELVIAAGTGQAREQVAFVRQNGRVGGGCCQQSTWRASLPEAGKWRGNPMGPARLASPEHACAV
jgi:hypothetical protein